MLRGIIVCAWAFATLASAAWAQDWPTESNADFDALLEAARAEGEIVIMGQPSLSEKFAAAFEADTGIKASFIPRGRGAERQRFYREVEADRLTIDVFLSGPTPFSLVEKDQLAPVRDMLLLRDLLAPEAWRGSALKWVDDAERYLPMPSIYAAGGILINTDIIDPASITSWDDLLAERMLDQVVMHNPARPGAGETLAMYLIDVKGEDFVRELLGNDRITLTSDYRQVVDLVARGTNPIALGALLANIQHYEDRGVDNLEIFWTNDVPGYVLGGGAVLAVPAGAPHPKAAAVFANWFLSQNGQEALALTQALPTDREDVDADLWPEYSDPRNRPELLNLYSQSWFFGTRLENRALLEGILAE